MYIDLKQVPFSRRGSYMAICHLPENFRGIGNRDGLYIRSMHGTCEGGAQKRSVGRLIPLYDGAECEYTYTATPYEIVISLKDGKIRICYDDSDTILFKGEGEKTGLRIEELSDGGGYCFAHEVYYDEKSYYLVNAAKNDCRYMTLSQQGNMQVRQRWEAEVSFDLTVEYTAENGVFLAVWEEVPVEWVSKKYNFNYDDSLNKITAEIDGFCNAAAAVPEEYSDTRRLAGYINWSSFVRKEGFLTRDAMFMSKNIMCAVWSWDHCFNAMAMAYQEPAAAWDQYMLLFDHQDATGKIPDYVNDSHILQGFCKPPIHGWTLSKMMQVMELDTNQLHMAYDRLCKWTRWWLEYRDHDNDGICEYYHGNDSGWDNATAFKELPPVELPDLTAFLIIQMDVISDIAGKLGRHREQQEWRSKADIMLDNMIKHCFKDGKPIALRSRTHQTVENDSLIMYVPVILGNRLPKEILNGLVNTLKSGKFYTDHGFATESPESALYKPDGYWRGPIWAPSSMIIIDGLRRSGEREFAKEAARRFCEMVKKSGCAENYDALTGEGLRDRAYTWTASVFLILAHEFLL